MTTREILGRLPFWLFSVSLALFIAVYTSTVFNLGLHFADRGLASGQASTLMQLVAVGGVAQGSSASARSPTGSRSSRPSSLRSG